jgi:AcrR family transcriptional regulator
MKAATARTKTRARRRPPAPASPPPAGTRERIIEAALRAFAGAGFEGARTRDIAAAAGVNQGLITYHFASKGELWKATVERIFEQARQAFTAPLQMLGDVDPATRLRLIVRQFVRFSAAHPELHRLIVEEGKSDSPRHRWLVDRHIRPLFEGTLAIIRQAQSDGVLADVAPEHLCYIFLGAAAHIFTVAPEYHRLTGKDPLSAASIEAHAEALVELLLRSGPGGAGGAPAGNPGPTRRRPRRGSR